MTSDHEQLERPTHVFSRFISCRCQRFLSPSIFIITLCPLELLPDTNLVVIDGIIVCMPWGVVKRSAHSKDVAQIQHSVRGQNLSRATINLGLF